jgi:hypothetical protein
MPTAALASDTTWRLRELHGLLVSEVDRNAHDNAMRLMKQIIKETRGAPPLQDVPTATAEGRLVHWHALYDRARKHHNIDRQMELLEAMRADQR